MNSLHVKVFLHKREFKKNNKTSTGYMKNNDQWTIVHVNYQIYEKQQTYCSAGLSWTLHIRTMSLLYYWIRTTAWIICHQIRYQITQQYELLKYSYRSISKHFSVHEALLSIIAWVKGHPSRKDEYGCQKHWMAKQTSHEFCRTKLVTLDIAWRRKVIRHANGMLLDGSGGHCVKLRATNGCSLCVILRATKLWFDPHTLARRT